MKQRDLQQPPCGDQESLLEDFFRRVAQAPCQILFLDYDGTLAPFARIATKLSPPPESAGASTGFWP